MMAGFAAGFPMGRQDIDHPIIRPLHAAAAGLLLWAQQAGGIDRQQWLPVRTALSSKCEKCHVFSCRRRLIADLLLL